MAAKERLWIPTDFILEVAKRWAIPELEILTLCLTDHLSCENVQSVDGGLGVLVDGPSDEIAKIKRTLSADSPPAAPPTRRALLSLHPATGWALLISPEYIAYIARRWSLPEPEALVGFHTESLTWWKIHMLNGSTGILFRGNPDIISKVKTELASDSPPPPPGLSTPAGAVRPPVEEFDPFRL